MPSKQIYVKPYYVKGHHRTIHTRTFKFICAHCDLEAERITYATTCPKYCDNCKDIKNKLGKKKEAAGAVVGDSLKNQAPTNTAAKQGQQILPTVNGASVKAISNNAQKSASQSQIDIPPQSTSTIKTGKKDPQQSPSRSSKDNSTTAANLELNATKLVEYINELLLVHDQKKLTSDAKNILIALWSGQNHEQIAETRSIKIKTIRKTSSQLMGQLSNVLGENISPRNLREAIDKHYRAAQTIS